MQAVMMEDEKTYAIMTVMLVEWILVRLGDDSKKGLTLSFTEKCSDTWRCELDSLMESFFTDIEGKFEGKFEGEDKETYDCIVNSYRKNGICPAYFNDVKSALSSHSKFKGIFGADMAAFMSPASV